MMNGILADCYTSSLGLAGGLTAGRARALVPAFIALISLIIGALAVARARRLGSGHGRTGALAALVLGLIGLVLSVIHLAGSTGFGTGGGRAGAIVGVVLGLIGLSLGGLALKHANSV